MVFTNSSDASTAGSSPPIQNVPVTVDTKGRVRASKEQRLVILAEFERSGMSAAQFAKLTGLKYSTLAGWLQRYRRGKSKSSPSPVRLLEAVVEPESAASGKNPLALVVELPGGARLEIAISNKCRWSAGIGAAWGFDGVVGEYLIGSADRLFCVYARPHPCPLPRGEGESL